MGSRTLTGYTVRKREGAVYGGSRTRAESFKLLAPFMPKGLLFPAHGRLITITLKIRIFPCPLLAAPLGSTPSPQPRGFASSRMDMDGATQQAASESGFFHFTNAFGMLSVSCPFSLPSDSSLLGCTAMCLSIPS